MAVNVQTMHLLTALWGNAGNCPVYGGTMMHVLSALDGCFEQSQALLGVIYSFRSSEGNKSINEL